MKGIWAVVPAYNEGRRIREVLKKITGHVSSVVVVDDGSRDSTFETAKSCNVKALRHIVNLGKGAALKTGCDYAYSRGAEVFIMIDADGQHDPSDIPRFLAEIRDRDIVFGIRKFTRSMPLILLYGNWFISSVTKLLYGIRISDTQCGYRCFTRAAYRKLRWKATDYSLESEMIEKTSRHNLRYGFVAIETVYSDRYKGTTVFDGIKIVMDMVLGKLSQLR
ncbi:MAG: glycosyltransferase family 2 protein [archaeon]